MYIHSNGAGGVLAYGRVSVTLIATLILQAAGVLIWATHLESRVNNMEQQSVNAVMLNEKFARLDERMEHLKQQILVMNTQLEQLNKRLSHGR